MKPYFTRLLRALLNRPDVEVNILRAQLDIARMVLRHLGVSMQMNGGRVDLTEERIELPPSEVAAFERGERRA